MNISNLANSRLLHRCSVRPKGKCLNCSIKQSGTKPRGSSCRPTRASVQDEESTRIEQPKVEDDDDGDTYFEQAMKARRRKQKEGGVKVVAPQVQQVYGGGEQPVVSQIETVFVRFLGIYFFLILFDGLLLAGSGFLPEAVDQFAQDVLYSSFSAVVGVFLLFSSAYGVWKTKGGGG